MSLASQVSMIWLYFHLVLFKRKKKLLKKYASRIRAVMVHCGSTWPSDRRAREKWLGARTTLDKQSTFVNSGIPLLKEDPSPDVYNCTTLMLIYSRWAESHLLPFWISRLMKNQHSRSTPGYIMAAPLCFWGFTMVIQVVWLLVSGSSKKWSSPQPTKESSLSLAFTHDLDPTGLKWRQRTNSTVFG